MPDTVLDIIHRLSRTRSEDEIATVVSQAVRMVLKADGATFALRDGDHCYYAGEDAVSPLWKGRRLPMNGCMAGWCMTNGEAVAIADIHQDARMFTAVYRPDFVRSLAVVPVGLDEPVAALGAYWSERRQPRAEDLGRLQAIADGAALALANLQLHAMARPKRPPLAPPAPAEPVEPASRGPDARHAAFAELRHRGIRPNSPLAYAFALGCVLVATLVRMAAGFTGLEGLAIFSLYYPATMVAALVGGRWAGMLAAVAGGLAADYFFMWPRHTLRVLTLSDLINLSLYAGGCAAVILAIDGYQRMVSRLKLEDARHLSLVREQQHRARNALAVVAPIVRQTLRTDLDLARLINQRIRAAFADVEIHLRTRPIRITALFAQELEPFDLTRFSLEGDGEIMIAPEACSILTLALHELATNALKYGALSASEGQVTVAWRNTGAAAVVRWCEAGGPRVQPPQRRGFGYMMLHRLVKAAGGAIVADFAPAGVTTEISLPLDAAKRPAPARQRHRRPIGEFPRRPPSPVATRA